MPAIASLVLILVVLSGCATKPVAPLEPEPPAPVAHLDSLRWQLSDDARTVTFHAAGRVPSSGWTDVALAARPRPERDVREFNFTARPPTGESDAAFRSVEAYLTFSLRAASRMKAVRVYTADAVLELPLEPVLNRKPPPLKEVHARLALFGPTPAAYVDTAVYSADGFRAYLRGRVSPLRLVERLRIEADPALEAQVLQPFHLNEVQLPIRFALPTGEFFDAEWPAQDADVPFVQVSLLREIDRTVATIADATAADDLAADLTVKLKEAIAERPTAVALSAGDGVPYADLVATGRAARAAGARFIVVR